MLVVDLDGTLLKSDMLHESFWSALGTNWRSPLLAAIALRQGKAALKDYLGSNANIDVSTLPYDNQVLDYIRAYRKNGGRVALVTASNQALANRVADYLQVFDEVYGSDRRKNLKGTEKAEFLLEKFGKDAFCYMGDADADLPVWEASRKIVTVNAPASLRKKAEVLGKPIEHLVTTEKSMRLYLKALRPHQWLKNALVFLPMLAAHQLDGKTFLLSLLAFVCFSLVASSVYVLNDLLDLAADRSHPRKKSRSFASGDIPIAHGSWMAAGLLLLGGLFAVSISQAFLLAMVAYYLLTTVYSLSLKRRVVIDICVLAGLYTMRIFAGGIATNLLPSFWLLAFSVFFFLSMAAVKRQAELIDSAARGNLTMSGRGYHSDDLPIISMIAIGAGYVSVLVMALYANSPDVIELYAYPQALWCVCVVLLYWITRTVMIAHRGNMHDDPVVFAFRDWVSCACAVVIVTVVILGATL